MVLQRDRAVQIFGKADAGEIVTVRFANQTKKTTADKDGKWRVNLEVMKANATPTSLIVEGKNKIEIKTYSLAKWDVRGAVEYGFQTWRFFERKRNSRES
jgi:sialate O-acetylesterase